MTSPWRMVCRVMVTNVPVEGVCVCVCHMVVMCERGLQSLLCPDMEVVTHTGLS